MVIELWDEWVAIEVVTEIEDEVVMGERTVVELEVDVGEVEMRTSAARSTGIVAWMEEAVET